MGLSLSDLDPRKVVDAAAKALEDSFKSPFFNPASAALRSSAKIEDTLAKALGLTGGKGGLSTLHGRKARKERERQAALAHEAGAPVREMARRDAIPLMVDEPAIEEARRRMLLTQSQRSGRQSTMLSSGLGG